MEVAVVIPNHNGERWLPGVPGSVAAQSRAPAEVHGRRRRLDAAALYRRSAVLAAGGFDERFGTYLEDVELGLRLRLAGWSCRWEPRATARHATGGSSERRALRRASRVPGRGRHPCATDPRPACGAPVAPCALTEPLAIVRAMPLPRSRIAALVAAAALAAPASAAAQSAGDEQYEDPFAGENQSQSQGGDDDGSAQEPAAPAPSVPAPAPEAAPGAAPSAATATATSQSELPYTGAEPVAVLLAGTLLLGGGIALRVRLRERS